MKTASIREVRNDFGRILEWVANGDEVAITRRRETVARLLPVARKKANRAAMPDVSQRLRKVFGKKVILDTDAAGLLDANRGNF